MKIRAGMLVQVAKPRKIGKEMEKISNDLVVAKKHHHHCEKSANGYYQRKRSQVVAMMQRSYG